MTHGESGVRSTRTGGRFRGRAALCVGALALAVLPLATTAGAAEAATPVAPLGIAAGGLLPYASQADRDTYLSTAHDLGARWLRFDMTWNDIQRSNTASYDWSRYDKVVADAQRHGFRVMGVIAWAPRWAQDPSCAGNHVCKPRSAEEYGRFAGAVAAHYAPRGVHHWEMWNEPNQNNWFAPAPDAGLYAAMLKSSYRYVHAADPAAQVVAAGPAPAATEGGTVSPIDFLTRLYAAGAGGSFDIMGSHPYCFAGSFDCPRQTEIWNAWSQMSETKVSLRSVMAANGDAGKAMWATEFGAPTNGSKAVTEEHQATMLVDALKLFGAESWSGPVFLHNLRDLGTNVGDREHWFGVLRADGSRKPAYDRLRALLGSSAQREVGGTSPAPAPEAPAPPVVAPTTAPAPAPTLVPPVATATTLPLPPAAKPAPRATGLPKSAPPERDGWFHRLVDRIFG